MSTTIRTIRGLIGTGVAALLLLALLPATASAQQQQEQETCTITVRSESGPSDRQEQQAESAVPAVRRGEAALALHVQLSENLQEISEFMAPEGSGLTLASPDDLSKTDMSRTGEQTGQPRPISMADGSRTVTVWINTEESSPGTYRVSFRGGDAACDARLRVTDGESGR